MSDVNKQLLDALKSVTSEIQGLMEESSGVVGFHLNGDVATWDELEHGGRFERLSSLSDALQAIAAAEQAKQDEPSQGWFDCLIEDVSAIDCMYRGDPTYEHDAYWMKDRVIKMLEKRRDAAHPPAVAVPQGYVLVPKEPTQEMLEAAWQYHCSKAYNTTRPDAETDAECCRAMLAAAPQGAVPEQAAAILDELTCEDVERLRLALSWEGYSTPESLESCAARWPSLVRDLIAGVLDRKKRTLAAAQKP